jgi:hypothetical protein
MKPIFRALSLLALSATVASAQDTWTGTYSVPSGGVAQFAWGGLGIGGYRGTLPAGAPAPITGNGGFDFWCVDAVGTYGGGEVVVSRISSLDVGPLKTSLAKAAYLTTLRSSFNTNALMSNLHGAIWSLTSGYRTGWTPSDQNAVNALIAQANANYQTVDLRNFYYVKFTNGHRQEQIYQGPPPVTVPEPSSLSLLALGGLLVGVARRRRLS